MLQLRRCHLPAALSAKAACIYLLESYGAMHLLWRAVGDCRDVKWRGMDVRKGGLPS